MLNIWLYISCLYCHDSGHVPCGPEGAADNRGPDWQTGRDGRGTQGPAGGPYPRSHHTWHTDAPQLRWVEYRFGNLGKFPTCLCAFHTLNTFWLVIVLLWRNQHIKPCSSNELRFCFYLNVDCFSCLVLSLHADPRSHSQQCRATGGRFPVQLI